MSFSTSRTDCRQSPCWEPTHFWIHILEQHYHPRQIFYFKQSLFGAKQCWFLQLFGLRVSCLECLIFSWWSAHQYSLYFLTCHHRTPNTQSFIGSKLTSLKCMTSEQAWYQFLQRSPHLDIVCFSMDLQTCHHPLLALFRGSSLIPNHRQLSSYFSCSRDLFFLLQASVYYGAVISLHFAI